MWGLPNTIITSDSEPLPSVTTADLLSETIPIGLRVSRDVLRGFEWWERPAHVVRIALSEWGRIGRRTARRNRSSVDLWRFPSWCPTGQLLSEE